MAMRHTANWVLLLLLLSGLLGCANISTPTGGKKDKTPPKLLSVTPGDSSLNIRATRIELHFDEYVNVGDVVKEVKVSPILPVPPAVTCIGKTVLVKIPDSLLTDNTTYHITFGSAIKDVHEGNAWAGHSFTFSTGGWFDSLSIHGQILNATTGRPDTSSVIAVLYPANANDSQVVRAKPLYAVSPDKKGNYIFTGLPTGKFRLYAIKDDNNNLTYDGGTEMIAFADSLTMSGDTSIAPVTLRMFNEQIEGAPTKSDSKKTKIRGKESAVDTVLTYAINVDTTNTAVRSFDLTDSIDIVFNHLSTLHTQNITLTRDSAGKKLPVDLRIHAKDSAIKLSIAAHLKEDQLYILHLPDGFAVDTAGHAAKEANYRFRTLNADDYGSMQLNIPGKYLDDKKAANPPYILVMLSGKDTVYHKGITDTTINFSRLKPANYTFCIIADGNRNGKWDSGDLFAHKQPEIVIPSEASVDIRAKWDNVVDFDIPANRKKDDLRTRTMKK